MKNIIDQLGGKKYIMTVLILLILTIFVCINKITAQQFLIILPIISGSYITGNIIQKFSKNE